MNYYIGIDLGGTAVKGGIIDEKMNILIKDQIDTEPSGGADAVISRMAELAKKLVSDAGIDGGEVGGIGVGTPGPIDPATNVVLNAPNLGWVNVPLASMMQEKTGWDSWAVNDANAACFGEFNAGVAKEVEITDIVLLTLGTGVGGGVVQGGKLFIGPHGAGAELGHVIIELNGRRCSCGQRGCVEQYTSATAIAREANRRMAAGQVTTLPNEPTTKDVFDAAAKHDELASSVVDEACEFLGAAIVSYTHVLDPQMVVLGGGVTAAGEALVSRVRKAFMKHNWKAAPPHLRIELATLGNDAGFIGAASLARDIKQAG